MTSLRRLRPAPVQSGFMRWCAHAAVIAAAAAVGSCSSSPRDVTGSIPGAATRGPDTGPIAALARAYDRAPEDRAAAMPYANALRNAGRTSEAIAVLQRLAARHPTDRDILAAYGKALAEGGRLQEAANVLRSAHLPERPDWTVLSAQGSVSDKLGDHRAAQGFYTAALRIAPGEPSVLSNLGLSYALTRNLQEAEQALRQASAHPRADARVRQNLSLVLALQGKLAEAEQIQLRDPPKDQAAANMAALRQIIIQTPQWRDMVGAATAPAPTPR